MTAPQPTVEALVYSCRQGAQALNNEANIRRLAALSKNQLREVVNRVQRFKPFLEYEGRKVTTWSADEAELLIKHWINSNGR
jgi:hypothetical protein